MNVALAKASRSDAVVRTCSAIALVGEAADARHVAYRLDAGRGLLCSIELEDAIPEEGLRLAAGAERLSVAQAEIPHPEPELRQVAA